MAYLHLVQVGLIEVEESRLELHQAARDAKARGVLFEVIRKINENAGKPETEHPILVNPDHIITIGLFPDYSL